MYYSVWPAIAVEGYRARQCMSVCGQHYLVLWPFQPVYRSIHVYIKVAFTATKPRGYLYISNVCRASCDFCISFPLSKLITEVQ